MVECSMVSFIHKDYRSLSMFVYRLFHEVFTWSQLNLFVCLILSSITPSSSHYINHGLHEGTAGCNVQCEADPLHN